MSPWRGKCVRAGLCYVRMFVGSSGGFAARFCQWRDEQSKRTRDIDAVSFLPATVERHGARLRRDVLAKWFLISLFAMIDADTREDRIQ